MQLSSASSAPTAAATEDAPAVLHPRQSLQRKLAVWTVVLVVAPTLGYALWLNEAVSQSLREHHSRNVAMLGQTLAAALSGRLNHDGAEVGKVLDALDLDQRLAFVVVTDAEGLVRHRRAVDSQAWVGYDRRGQWPGAIQMDQAIVLGEHGDLIVRKAPIWNPPLHVRALDRPSSDHVERKLEGFVIIALREHGLAATLQRLRAMQIIAAAVVCLVSVPVVVWAVRRWMAPLRALIAATLRLGAGHAPTPVGVDSQDELGLLAETFNDMAGKWWSARQQLQRANEDLERKVQLRTAELEQLNHRLQSEINDRNEFLRAVTHDLSAPLRNINGMTSMLLMKYQSQLCEDVQQKLQRINANVKAQNELINDLLELSRLRTRIAKREVVDLHELVEQLRDSLSYDLERSGIQLEIPDHLPMVVAERNRLRQVFQNLLDNAVKYMMDAPARRIVVRHRLEDDHLYFTVSDTGAGIDPKDLPHIFEVFHRASYGPARSVGGRGVGLASVKTIVELYGGRIWVESQLGQGSSFHFTLNRRLVQPEGSATPASQAASVA